jgi:hypothetical protein
MVVNIVTMHLVCSGDVPRVSSVQHVTLPHVHSIIQHLRTQYPLPLTHLNACSIF